jgi:hypothetical protein
MSSECFYVLACSLALTSYLFTAGLRKVNIWNDVNTQSHRDPDDRAGMVPDTSVLLNQLTWLIAREDFINASRRESFTSYKERMVCVG